MRERGRRIRAHPFGKRLQHGRRTRRRTPGVTSSGRKQVIAILRAQRRLVDLPDRGVRDLINEDDVVGHPPAGDLAFEKVEQSLPVGDSPLRERDNQQRALVPFGMTRADDRHLTHIGMTHDNVFEVYRRDPLAARLHQILRAIGDVDVSVLVDDRDVAGIEKAVAIHDGLVGRTEVIAHDARPAGLQVAHRLAVTRQSSPRVVRRAVFNQVGRPALRLEQSDPLLAFEIPGLRNHRADRSERPHFGHSVGRAHLDAVAVRELFDHRRGAGRAAHVQPLERRERQVLAIKVIEHALPHRRHAACQRDILVDQQLAQRRAVEPGTGKHQSGPGHRGRIGPRPSVGMTHGRNLQHDIHGRKAVHVRRGAGQRHQHDRAMRQQHTLGVACRARRVDQAGRRIFVKRRPDMALVAASDPLLVGDCVAQMRIGHMRAVRQDDVALNPGQPVSNAFEQSDEAQVNEEHTVARLVDDIDDLVGK